MKSKRYRARAEHVPSSYASAFQEGRASLNVEVFTTKIGTKNSLINQLKSVIDCSEWTPGDVFYIECWTWDDHYTPAYSVKMLTSKEYEVVEDLFDKPAIKTY